MTLILGIDPGPTKSGWVLYDTVTRRLEGMGISPIHAVMEQIDLADEVWIEDITTYSGRGAVGWHVIETCVHIGRVVQMAEIHGIAAARVTRPAVCRHLCGDPRATKPMTREAIIDQFDPHRQFGRHGKGVSASPGPLFGVRSHIWDAVAVAQFGAEHQDGDTQ